MKPSTDRVSVFREFERRFRKPRDYPAPPAPVPATSEQIELVERSLCRRLPKAYVEFVTEIGPCEVRGLSDSWLFNNHSEVPVPFESIWGPQELIKQCGYEWLAPIPAELAGGLPVASDVAWRYLLPFASDGGGNWHCFSRQAAELDDAPVYYFDHDGGDIGRIAGGFEELIRIYMQLPVA